LPLPGGPTSATAVLGGTVNVTPLRISRSPTRSRISSSTSSVMPLPTITDWDADTTLALLASMGQLLVRWALARKSTRVEKCLFLLRARTAERFIAMREAAETPDDVAVQLCPAGEVRVAECINKRDGARLVGLVLRMLERKVKKQSLRCRHRLIEAARDRALGHRAGHRIGCEGAGVGAKHVARELIEQEDEGERVLRRGLPHRRRAGRPLLPLR